MSDRIQRLEFSSLYALYLQKNEEFRQAVRNQRRSAELDELRESIQQIYRRMREKRDDDEPRTSPGQAAPAGRI
ncbi:MAG: hypothetical protein EOO11_14695 [Chitinophagaceae bacterium]|nr:MAG: hypothetical protein EOO11_14695 [Chitinophagaceae bacterium]